LIYGYEKEQNINHTLKKRFHVENKERTEILHDVLVYIVLLSLLVNRFDGNILSHPKYNLDSEGTE